MPRASRRLASLLLEMTILASGWTGVLAGAGTTIDATDAVVRVIDGDTFEARRLGRIRLADVDAPELGEPGGNGATEHLRALIRWRPVFLDIDVLHGTDKYGRTVAVVYVEHNATHLLNVNLVLFEAGRVRIADYPNEFDPSSWLRYVPRPAGMGTNGLDSRELVVLSLTAIIIPVTVGVLMLLKFSNPLPRRGKIEPRLGPVRPTRMKSHTWKQIPSNRFDELREVLLRLGAIEDEEVRGQSELWRCRVDDGVFTMYETGTLYFSGAKSREAEIAARGVDVTLREG